MSWQNHPSRINKFSAKGRPTSLPPKQALMFVNWGTSSVTTSLLVTTERPILICVSTTAVTKKALVFCRNSWFRWRLLSSKSATTRWINVKLDPYRASETSTLDLPPISPWMPSRQPKCYCTPNTKTMRSTVRGSVCGKKLQRNFVLSESLQWPQKYRIIACKQNKRRSHGAQIISRRFLRSRGLNIAANKSSEQHIFCWYCKTNLVRCGAKQWTGCQSNQASRIAHRSRPHWPGPGYPLASLYSYTAPLPTGDHKKYLNAKEVHESSKRFSIFGATGLPGLSLPHSWRLPEIWF